MHRSDWYTVNEQCEVSLYNVIAIFRLVWCERMMQTVTQRRDCIIQTTLGDEQTIMVQKRLVRCSLKLGPAHKQYHPAMGAPSEMLECLQCAHASGRKERNGACHLGVHKHRTDRPSYSRQPIASAHQSSAALYCAAPPAAPETTKWITFTQVWQICVMQGAALSSF